MKPALTTLMALALLGTAAALAPARAQEPTTVRYTGRDGNWFKPDNWSTRRVPTAGQNVVIGGSARVVVDPALGTAEVTIQDLTLTGNALLRTLPGTVWNSRNETVKGSATLVHRATIASGQDLTVGTGESRRGGRETQPRPGGYGSGGILINPSTQSHRDVILKTSATIGFGLGGNQPASPAGVGDGFHAVLNAETIQLGGKLQLPLLYGFRPTAGETYTLINVAQTRTGRFKGLPEGALVSRSGRVGLYITYQGGDGNDVAIQARTVGGR